MTVMKCPNCQDDVEPGDLFCGNCGARLSGAAAAPQPPHTEVAPATSQGTSRYVRALLGALLLGAGWVGYHVIREELRVAETTGRPLKDILIQDYLSWLDIAPKQTGEATKSEPPRAQPPANPPAQPPAAADATQQRQKFSGVYRAVPESEWALSVALRPDGVAIITRESWEPGGYENRKSHTYEGRWTIAGENFLRLEYGGKSETVRFDDALSFSDFGQQGAAPGIKGTQEDPSSDLAIGQVSLWRAEALDRLFASPPPAAKAEAPAPSAAPAPTTPAPKPPRPAIRANESTLNFSAVRTGPLSGDEFFEEGVRLTATRGQMVATPAQPPMTMPAGASQVMMMQGDRITEFVLTFDPPVKSFSLTLPGLSGGSSFPSYSIVAYGPSGAALKKIGVQHWIPKTPSPRKISYAQGPVARAVVRVDNRFGETAWATYNCLPITEIELRR